MSQKDDILETLQQVKYVGQATADQLYETLDIRGLADLVEAAEDEQVQQLSGIGASREQDILASARRLVEESADEAAGDREADEPEDDEQEEPLKPRIDRFLERMRCPACGHDTFDRDRATMTCTACRREYNIRSGIADLAAQDLKTGGLTQRVMESRFYSKFYEKLMRPRLTSVVSDRTMEDEKELAAEMLELDGESVLLDVACGTGNFTRHFAESIAATVTGYDDTSLVVGMDVSWPMLEKARDYLRRDGLNDRIFLIRGNAMRMPLGRESFNRLHCAGALHLMDDIDEALRNFARVLEPGGICVIGTFLNRGGFLRRMTKKVAEIPSQFHWFDRDELHQRCERAGLTVLEESISREAVTVKTRRQ